MDGEVHKRMMGCFRSIPEDLEDAAMIDGATRLQAFLPLRSTWWKG